MRKSARQSRNPEDNRRAILHAARLTFAEQGYRGATLRGIARRAGVTHGLITRNFGSKQALFQQAVHGGDGWLCDVAATPRAMSEAVAMGDAPADQMVSLLLSAADRDRALILCRHLVAGCRWFCRDPLRSDLVLSLMLGSSFLRLVMGEGVLAEMPAEDFAPLMEGLLSQLIEEDLPRRQG